MSLSIEKLQELDRQFYLHPFTNHDEMQAKGTLIMAKGDGCWVTDATGKKYLDGIAGLWCVNVGYNRPEIVEAVRKQMEQLAFYPSFFNTTTEPTIRLAEELAHIAPPGLKHTIFSNSGTEANETALKIIRGYYRLKGKPEKNKILSRQFSYHGVSLGAVSLTGLPGLQTPFDLPLPGFLHAPAPFPYSVKSPLDAEAYGKWCIEETAKMIEKEGAKTIAALFAEPIQGAGGVIVPTPSYLKALRKLAKDNDILFVADEVITGFGRVGEWFASILWDLQPDIMTLAKGVTSGYLPLGATMVNDEIANALIHGGYFAHGFTYSGHPSACAAALANIGILKKENLVTRVKDDVGPYLQQKLQSLKGHPAVAEVRGCQLIGAIELVAPKEKTFAPNTLAPKMNDLLRQEGIIVRAIRDLIAVSPPFTIKREEIDLLFAGINKCLDRLWD